jgi:hypothetical protein
LKRAWMKFSLCASVIVFAACCASFAGAGQYERRVNEMTLAGLRPGKDTFTSAEKRYKSKFLVEREKEREKGKEKEKSPDKSDEKTDNKGDNFKEWLDDCRGRSLKVELDGKGVIQSITISSLAPQDGECKDRAGDILNTRQWMTGRGLRLSDPRDRIIEIYGEPNSSGPSVKGTRELELLYYAFDWAGSDVPQVMEISCERSTGKVLEITLAYPSL